MANAGQLYLGDDSGFNRQLDWRHKIIDQDKQDRIEVANQLRDDVLTLGAKVSHNIERYGFGPSVDDDGKYIGKGTGGRDLEVMKRKVQETDRNFKLRHNEAIIKAGLIDIQASKDYDLNQRWYGVDPVGLEKNHAKEVSRIMQDMGNYLPWQKIQANPTFYTQTQVDSVLDILNSNWDQEKKTKALEAIQATPLVFTQWAERNKLVNTKYVKTYPQATKALRNRMIDMGYLDGNLFAETSNDGLYAQSNAETALQGSSEVVDPLQVDLSELDQNTGGDGVKDAGNNTQVITQESEVKTHYDGKKLQNADSSGRRLLNVGGGNMQWIYPDHPLYNRIDTKGNLIPEEKKTIIGYKNVPTGDRRRMKRVPIYEGENSNIYPPPPQKTKTKSQPWYKGVMNFFGDTAEAAQVDAPPMPANLNSPRIRNLVRYEGYGEKGTQGMLYKDGSGIAFPGGINAGSWAHGKSDGDKKSFSRLLSIDNSGKVREGLANDILELLNTQGGSKARSAKLRLKKYAKGTDDWKKIKISRQGMKAGIDFISNYNISELVRTNSYLKDPNVAGRKLNQNFPEEFRDLLADITYRFGGGAFSHSKSLRTPDKKRLPFEMVLKKIVNAKNPSERSIALQSFKDLFLKTKIYKDEKDKQGVNRVQDAIKAIDNLTGSWS